MKLARYLSLICCLGFLARAANIVTVSPESTIPGTYSYTFDTGESWSQTTAFTDVSVSAYLYSAGPGVFGADWLTNAVGPATLANTIASGSFTPEADFSQIYATPLFTGLSLPAGTYYLIVAGNTDTIWLSGLGVTTGPGVTFNRSFNTTTPGVEKLGLVVTGTPAVPEPSFVVPSLLAVCFFYAWRYGKPTIAFKKRAR